MPSASASEIADDHPSCDLQVTKSQAEEEIGQYEEASAESNDTIEKLTPEATELGEQIKAMRSKTAKFKVRLIALLTLAQN